MKFPVWQSMVALFVVLAVSSVGLVIYNTMRDNTHVWSDNGKVDWIGEKVFVDDTSLFGNQYWGVAYSVATLSHGELNFTAQDSPQLIKICGNSPKVTISMLSLGVKVGVVKLGCGNYDLSVDP